MEPTNPYAVYAPPAQPQIYRRNVVVPAGAASAPLLGSGLRNAKLALGIVQMIAMIGGFGLLGVGAVVQAESKSGASLLLAGGGLLAFWNLTLVAYMIVTMVWAHRFWSWIPPEQRYMSLWKQYVSPLQATLFMLIPFFGFYWVVALNLGTAEILDRMRVAYPTNRPSAKNIAIVTCIVPYVFYPAMPIVDYLFDKHVEGIAADMQAQMRSSSFGEAHAPAAG